MLKEKPVGSLWTDDQWKAVVTTGQNILVSAGAGSGKTAVLTERIIEHVKSGIDIRSLVVLTFTNAAAREMRERVHGALTKACVDNPNLKQQLEYIDQAQITTFDAYSQFLLKKYHYVLNIDSNFQIIDNVTVRQLKEEIVNDLFESYYEMGNQDLIDLATTTTIMDDNKLRQQVLFLMEKLANDMQEYNHDDFIKPELIDRAIAEYEQVLAQKIKEMESAVIRLNQLIPEEKFLDVASLMSAHYQDLFNAKSYLEIRNFILSTDAFKKQVPRVKHPDKELYKEVMKQAKDAYKKVVEMAKYESTHAMMDELKAAHRNSAIITELAIKANERLIAEKLTMNAYEFIDISKLVIKILKENDDILNELKMSINEILLDEYQDTNDIQEEFINLLANDNVYMVGDIKQAIYGFRNANPRNFAQKYLNYQAGNGGMVIDLNKNFRSREEVLANINEIFDPLMCLEVGGIDYEGKQRLVYGNKMYETKNHEQNHDMDIISYEASEEIKRHEQEARLIAKDILDKIANNYEVNQGGKLRRASYKDFAVLTSTKTNFGLYKRIFEEYKIPMQVQSTISDETENEILVISSLFKLLATLDGNSEQQRQKNREYFKFALMSLGRSYICNFNDYDLTKQVAQSRSLYDVLKNPVSSEIEYFAKNIKEIYEYYQTYDLNATLMYAIRKLGIYREIYQLDSVHNSEAKIRQMLDLFAKFSSEHKNLDDVIAYMELLRLRQEKFELEEASIENDDVVTMMTIHKSKGLEFNVVYFPQMEGSFNTKDITQKEMYSRDYGYIYQTLKDYELHETILHTVVKTESLREMISEQIRLFYVALTRAKDKFIILSQREFSAAQPVDQIPVIAKMDFKSFMDFLTSAEGNLYPYNKPLFLESQDLTAPSYFEEADNKEVKVYPKYQYEQINIETSSMIRMRASMNSNALIDPKTKANMQLGTAYHEVLETIDFATNIDEQIINVDAKIKPIVKNISELEQVKGATRCYNEYQFIYSSGEREIVGIIDLLVEKENELIIIDYKLDNIHKEEYNNQIQTYANYLKQKSNKKVTGFLYSLVRNELKEVDIDV